MKTLHFISGLPRSGSALITNVLKQNPELHGEAVSSLSAIFSNVNAVWDNIEANQIKPNQLAKLHTLKSIMNGYYGQVEQNTVFDRDLSWIPLIPAVESVLERPIKILVCVRNPAEILASYERLRKENPLYFSRVDLSLKGGSSIASRAYYYAGPEGILGVSHRNIKDAIVMGYLDRMLFVDYGRFCSSPKSQTKRIYDFFEIPNYEHDFNQIESTIVNETVAGLQGLYKLKPKINKTTVNCVEYLGLDLYEQYNREIFWNAWI